MACDCDGGTLLAADIRDDQACPNCADGRRVANFMHNFDNGLEPHNPGFMEDDD